jgi:hypothetical protein
MADLKHIGRFRATGRKCLIAYRTLPGESDSALVIQTEALASENHDALMNLVESQGAQSAYEFAEVLARSRFSDGSVMLSNLHLTGKLTKVKTSEIEVMPNTKATIGLDALNQLIAEQKGVSVNDLALGNLSSVNDIQNVGSVNEVPPPLSEPIEQPAFETKVNDKPLTDDDLAKKYRSDADRLSKEAASLRRMAEELVPTKKKATASV